jgi:putative ABC transport system permease protein
MIASDFKTAVRNIVRNKVTSIISIIGLGIGLGSLILLQLLIIHETSFDRYIPDYRNVNRVIFGETDRTAYPLAEEMKKDFPEVTGYFRIYQSGNFQLRNLRNEVVREENFAFADSTIFRILGIKLTGTPANSQSEMAISEKMAKKYFGNSSPLGMVLKVKLNNEFLNLSVSGIYKDFPSTSTLYPDFIADIKLSEKVLGQFKQSLGQFGVGLSPDFTWNFPAFYTYAVLDRNANKSMLLKKMEKFRELMNDESAKELKFSFQPVNETYLGSARFQSGYSSLRRGNSNELKYYWSISFIILLISVTNYIFLTRAATSDRLREMGTRKVLGASKYSLRRQIILESTLVTILSLIPVAFIIDPGISFINNTLNRTLTTDVFLNPVTWLTIITIVILTGMLSGMAIGFNLSRIPALLLLSAKTSEKSRSRIWDSSFLVFHFSLYLILVVCVITVSKQIKYSLTSYKGINPKNIMVSELTSPSLKTSFTALCSEMEKTPGVIKVAGSSYMPPSGNILPLTLANPEGEKIRFDGLIMGEGMTEMLGIEIIDGSPFGTFQPWPRIELLINESGAKEHNIKSGDMFLGVFHIMGIVKDFHAHSFHTLIQPLAILQQNPEQMGVIAIKTDGSNDKTVIKRLRDLYSQIAPDEIFEIQYLTNTMDDFYSYDKNQGKIIGAFSILAAVLSIMGLFGIALISISRKTKEIGIRKVNGASIIETLFLINREFVRWVIISLVIGIPIGLYLASGWQNSFAYKTELSWWIFAVAGLSALLIAVLTVSWQSWRAATRNPVEALRYE